MMKMCRFFAASLLLLLCLAGLAPACAEGETDFAASVQLNLSSDTVKMEAAVETFIDGDTTHFLVSGSDFPGGMIKIRYLGINTPECTGKIEEYGKKAARFTREKLESAVSIILESDNGDWNRDSTGGRYLAWVWYQPEENAPYRNLNIEILQNGLAIANSVVNNRYGDICVDALNQAKGLKLNMYSGQKDPDFYYGDAIELTLKELRCNLPAYDGKKVAFHGVVTMNHNNSVFVEAYDPETDLYFGLSVYYGYGLSAKGLEILGVGNEVRIVGTVQYYEAGGTWQVSDLTYRMMKPKDPGNIQKLSEGHQPAYVPLTAQLFNHGKVTVQGEEANQEFDFAALAIATSVEMKNLKVESIYTTEDEESSSNGAMTLTCVAEDGEIIQVRTAVLYENNARITAEKYLGKTIDVKGIVDFFEGGYQIKVFTPAAILIHP